MKYLIDTNIVSELASRRPDASVLRWAENISSIYLSVVTVEEIHYGLAAKPNPRIHAWFEDFFSGYCEILPVSRQIAQWAGERRGQFRTKGQTRTQADMLIAATAAVHGLALVTRNVRDFDDCGIALLNPFGG